MICRVVRRKFPKSLFMIDDIDYVDPISWEVGFNVLLCKLLWLAVDVFCLHVHDFAYVAGSNKVIKRVYNQTSKFCLIISYGGRGSRSSSDWANMDANTISTSTSLSKKAELELPLDHCPVQIECVLLCLLFSELEYQVVLPCVSRRFRQVSLLLPTRQVPNNAAATKADCEAYIAHDFDGWG